MAAAAKLFDLLLLALREKWSTRAQQSAGTATLELRSGRKEKLYQHGKDAIIFHCFQVCDQEQNNAKRVNILLVCVSFFYGSASCVAFRECQNVC